MSNMSIVYCSLKIFFLEIYFKYRKLKHISLVIVSILTQIILHKIHLQYEKKKKLKWIYLKKWKIISRRLVPFISFVKISQLNNGILQVNFIDFLFLNWKLIFISASCFQRVTDCQIFTGNLVNVQTLRKEKFPREFFPEVQMNLERKK